jgi:hypothetical protein
MAGATRTTGHSGPPPNPNARRRNARPVETVTLDLDKLQGDTVEVPAPNEDWHPVAMMAWDSLVKSVTAHIYEPSDWAFAHILCEQISRAMKPKKVQVGVDGAGEPILVEAEVAMSGAELQAVIKGFNSLIATEGDRRRLQIEVKRRGQAQNGADSKTRSQKITQNRMSVLKGGRTD